jgi:ABC-type nitrate/sulfonate/bicarbonate transport system substrate-binding protein
MSRKTKRSVEVVYTICPVLVASHVALAKGWLETELGKVKGKLKYLRSLPQEEWLTHFTHARPNQIRDGGNIPAIWARSRGEKTRLIGLTFSTDGGHILARSGSGIRRVGDLKGRRVGIFKRQAGDRVDFHRAVVERGILAALEVNGLKRKDVKWVDLGYAEPDSAGAVAAKHPAALWEAPVARDGGGFYKREIGALRAGDVEAIYANRGRSLSYQGQGDVKAIEDLGRYPDWTLQIANSPFTLAVSEDLAANHPELVVAYLRAVIKASRWIKEDPAAAALLFAKVLPGWDAAVVAESVARFDLVPSLSPRNLAALNLQKDFLLDHGYIKHDFEVSDWADPRFLEEALGGKSRVVPPW